MERLNARMALYSLAGVYLLYMAWKLFNGLETAGNYKPVAILFIIIFTVAGSGLIIGWLYTSVRNYKEQKKKNKK